MQAAHSSVDRRLAKKWDQVEHICATAAHAKLPRNGVLVAVGGGVTLDVAGLAAALYRRGVGYLRVPTTLVGMIDVALGVKQGVNFVGKKNLLGTFYAPLGGVLDLSFLATLRDVDLTCGFAEIIKVAMVRDAVLFELLEQYALPLLRSRFQKPASVARRVTLRAAHTMMADLQTDLLESVHSRFPDFGHTFSPAVEAASSYSLPHGHAVAADMLLTTVLAVERGICPADALRRLVELYEKLNLTSFSNVCTPAVLAGALTDARLHRGGALHVVAPTGIGCGCFLEDVEPPEVARASRIVADLCRPYKSYASSGI
jgi:3-dehydroquinate synthase